MSSQRLVAVRLAQPALSNVWWPFAPSGLDERHEKALTLWFNSTLGLILVTGHRTPTEGPWVQFKKPALQELPTLDVRQLTDHQLTILAGCYDAVAEEALLPLQSMATDANRGLIDRAFSQAFSLPPLGGLRGLLAQEPVIANTRLEPDQAQLPPETDQLALL